MPDPDRQTFHSYAPQDGHGLRHDPLNSIVGPRPIGWISTLSEAGARNLAPYSFFNVFNYHPPILGFSSIGWKDTVANVSATGEFVWNLVTRDLGESMNATSAGVLRGVDEFTLAGLVALPSTAVRPPRVAAAHVAMECRLTALHRLTDVGGAALDTWLVLGQVVMIHIEDSLVEGGAYETARAEPILRGGGPSEYFSIDGSTRFEMIRPR